MPSILGRQKGADDFLHLEWNKLTLFEAEGNFTMRNLSLQSSWGPYANNMSDNKGVVASFHVMLISIQAHTQRSPQNTNNWKLGAPTHTYCDGPLSMMVVASSFFA
jgi:uncharacterized membrane protein YdcZ (DUF606 family)